MLGNLKFSNLSRVFKFNKLKRM